MEVDLQISDMMPGPVPGGVARAEGEKEYSQKQQLEAEAEKIFKTADRNNDGELTKTELKKYLQGDAELKESLMGSQGWQEFFAELDKDGDSKFSLEEFQLVFVKKQTEAQCTQPEKGADGRGGLKIAVLDVVVGPEVQLGGAVAASVWADQLALCDKVKPLVEEHLDVTFSKYVCVEALSQVVAGTNWFFKVQVAGDGVEKSCVWLKIFEQPWTSTLQVLGVQYAVDCGAPLAYFESNCEMDASGACAAPVPVMVGGPGSCLPEAQAAVVDAPVPVPMVTKDRPSVPFGRVAATVLPDEGVDQCIVKLNEAEPAVAIVGGPGSCLPEAHAAVVEAPSR